MTAPVVALVGVILKTGAFKWITKNIANKLLQRGVATRPTTTQLNSSAADLARKNPIKKASDLPRSIIKEVQQAEQKIATKAARQKKLLDKRKKQTPEETKAEFDKKSKTSKTMWEKRKESPEYKAQQTAKQEAEKAAKAAKATKEAEKAAKPRPVRKYPKEDLTFKERGAQISRERLDKYGIKGDYDKTNPEHVRLYAKGKQAESKVEAARKAADWETTKKLRAAKQIKGKTQITPASEKGMPFARKGETTRRKRGGKIKKSYARGGGVRKTKG